MTYLTSFLLPFNLFVGWIWYILHFFHGSSDSVFCALRQIYFKILFYVIIFTILLVLKCFGLKMPLRNVFRTIKLVRQTEINFRLLNGTKDLFERRTSAKYQVSHLLGVFAGLVDPGLPTF